MNDISNLKFMLDPFITLFTSILVSGVATSYAVQFLKSSYVSWLPAEKYPRLTNAIVSVVATFIAVIFSDAVFVITTWWEWVAFFFGVMLLSANTYNSIISKSQKIVVVDETKLSNEAEPVSTL